MFVCVGVGGGGGGWGWGDSFLQTTQSSANKRTKDNLVTVKIINKSKNMKRKVDPRLEP